MFNNLITALGMGVIPIVDLGIRASNRNKAKKNQIIDVKINQLNNKIKDEYSTSPYHSQINKNYNNSIKGEINNLEKSKGILW